MTSKAQRFLAICLLSATVTACGSNNANTTPVALVTPPAAKVEDGFGAGFGTAYRADPNTEAKDPVATDINPVDPTKEPTTI